MRQDWRIPPLYFSTKMRPEELKKNFLDTAPPPYLKVWIHHWTVTQQVSQLANESVSQQVASSQS